MGVSRQPWVLGGLRIKERTCACRTSSHSAAQHSTAHPGTHRSTAPWPRGGRLPWPPRSRHQSQPSPPAGRGSQRVGGGRIRTQKQPVQTPQIAPSILALTSCRQTDASRAEQRGQQAWSGLSLCSTALPEHKPLPKRASVVLGAPRKKKRPPAHLLTAHEELPPARPPSHCPRGAATRPPTFSLPTAN